MSDESKKPNFIRTGDKTWITRSIADNQFHKLQELRWDIQNLYRNVELKTIEDVQYYQDNSNDLSSRLKDAIDTAFGNSSNTNTYISPSKPSPMAKYYFLQITFIDDASNCDFILKCSNPDDNIVKLVEKFYYNQ
jgi:hypothetical protein